MNFHLPAELGIPRASEFRTGAGARPLCNPIPYKVAILGKAFPRHTIKPLVEGTRSSVGRSSIPRTFPMPSNCVPLSILFTSSGIFRGSFTGRNGPSKPLPPVPHSRKPRKPRRSCFCPKTSVVYVPQLKEPTPIGSRSARGPGGKLPESAGFSGLGS